MDYIMGYDHSLDQKDILKFVYCFIIFFLIVNIVYYWYHLVTKGV
jgi:sterol desaturase/sphingolipid hydroxylase (fatty acid hydroxylase superfamily)